MLCVTIYTPIQKIVTAIQMHCQYCQLHLTSLVYAQFLSNSVVLNKLLLAVKQNNSKFSDFKLVFSTRIHFGLRTNLIILPYLAKPRIR